MADTGDGNHSNAQPKCSPTAITDAPITDPGSSIKNIEGSNAFVGQRKLESKSAAALKKSSRYRSRSLSASSTDSYSSACVQD